MRRVLYNGVVHDVSDWAKYIATDENGEVWEHKNKPKVVISLAIWSSSAAEQYLGSVDRCHDWKNSLQKVEDLPTVEE